jgi:hypothetical protein
LIIFIIGTGSVTHFHALIYSKICFFSIPAQASTKAIETHKRAFAQKFDLFFVPSSCIRN